MSCSTPSGTSALVAFQARLGLAGGGFASPETYGSGFVGGSFDLADLNADGLIDVVTANSSSSALVVLQGTEGQRLVPVLFRGGPEPPEPGALDCGADPTADELGTCASGCS